MNCLQPSSSTQHKKTQRSTTQTAVIAILGTHEKISIFTSAAVDISKYHRCLLRNMKFDSGHGINDEIEDEKKHTMLLPTKTRAISIFSAISINRMEKRLHMIYL